MGADYFHDRYLPDPNAYTQPYTYCHAPGRNSNGNSHLHPVAEHNSIVDSNASGSDTDFDPPCHAKPKPDTRSAGR